MATTSLSSVQVLRWLAGGILLLALILGAGGTPVVAANVDPEEEADTAASEAEVTPRTVFISTPVFYRQVTASVFISAGSTVSFTRCCSIGSPRAVLDCGINSFNNIGRFGVKDLYASSDQCCFYRLQNEGLSDTVQPILKCVRE
jgi:hypothetical protein